MSAPRKVVRRTTALSAALITLSLGATACQSKTHLTAAGTSASGSGDPRRAGATGGSGTLNWEWQLPTSWDPVTSTAGWDVHVLSLVYSSITGLDPTGKAVPAVATSWKYAADGKSIDFTLRSGLKFSDGTPLDAAAVKTNLERGRDEPNSRIASQLREVTKVVVKSPTEVELDLSQVDYQIPNLLAGKTGMLVSPAAITKDEKGLSTKPVGDGPFTLTTYVPDSHADLVRNPGYYNADAIKLAKFSVKAISDPQQILAALQSGDVNVAVIPGSLAKAAQAAGLRAARDPGADGQHARHQHQEGAVRQPQGAARRSTTPSTARRSSTPRSSATERRRTSRSPRATSATYRRWPTSTRTTRPRPSSCSRRPATRAA